ncbi:MAG: hypothetical protein AAB859_00740, partial [Patescibacteria group bacterium]
MKNNKLTNVLLILSFIVLIFGSGYKIGEYKSRFSSLRPMNYALQPNINFDLFWETWNKLQERYVDQKKIDPKKLYMGAIK